MFRRRKKDDRADQVEAGDVEASQEEELEGETTDEPAAPARPRGPWDVDDLPEDDEVDRVDLGGLLVPVPPDTEVRVDVNQQHEVVSATLVRGDSSMQVNAFAAPRTTGIWDEVRAEIGEALVAGAGRAQEVPGPHGTELAAGVPVEGGGLAPARFLGVDGPRWFLRALITGPAAQDPSLAAPFEAALRDVVVVRGTEAMAVRDPLPLRLPKDVAEQAAAAREAAEQQATGLQVPERGPEITEVR